MYHVFYHQVERLLELHFKYLERVRNCDRGITRDKAVSAQTLKWMAVWMNNNK